MRDPRYYCVYIMGSLTGTLYIGVSGNLHRRVSQHKFHHHEGFTSRYEVVRLLYWESYGDVHKALAREKQLIRMGAGQEDRTAGAPQSAVEGLSLRVVPVDGAGCG
jgi:predicted GIY-YIG superfamily endonuclease